jgi:flagellar basal-body rod protein FlgG
MIKALYTAATGLSAQQLVVNNTANNLANVNTTGFKRSLANFQDLLYETRVPAGTQVANGLQVPTGIQVGSGVRVAGNTKLFSEGSLANTGNPLDVAIQGDGFFKITMPSGNFLYTRDGSFRMNATGELVTTDGYTVEPKITIPQDALHVSIGPDGTVSATTAGSPSKPSTLGQLTVTRFPNPTGLSSEGNNLYSETAASGSPKDGTAGLNGAGSIQGGFLESSNVDVVLELSNLIEAQRAYEFNTRSIKAADEMLSQTNELMR